MNLQDLYPKQSFFQDILLSTSLLILLLLFQVIFSDVKAQENENKHYSRIASIGGSVSEIIYALGEEKRLIARDTTSIFPQAILSLPDVGYIRRLSPEGVLSVNPDLILALEGAGPIETIETLKEANVPIVFVSEGYTAEKIIEKILTIGSILGVSDKAKNLADETLLALRHSHENAVVNEKVKVLFILSIQGGKILAAGSDTAADGIIKLSGAENIMANFTGYKQVSDEAIIALQPDVILMMEPRGNHSVTDADILQHPAIAITPAGRHKNLIRMNGLYLLGFGPRTAQAIHDLQTAFSEIK